MISGRKYYIGILIVFMVSGMLTGCVFKNKDILDSENPTVVTVWHSYNAYAKNIFDNTVVKFNDTVGAEMGIVIDAYGYGSSDELDTALYQSANEVIGAERLPDIAVIYPDSACRLNREAPLVDLKTYFTAKELERYQPEFLQEGIWEEDGILRMIPIAKSTELLYINETVWESFAEEAEVSRESLATWEGLVKTAESYYEWTGGKAFLGFNSYNNFAVLSAAQQGTKLYREQDGKTVFCFPETLAKAMWDVYYVPHIRGWYQSQVYNQDGIKSGKLAAYIGSSAGASYFPKEVIMDEQHTYPVSSGVLAYPHFEQGEAYMTQRGANACIFQSDEPHEYAAAEFIKWFTQPEQNTEFAISTGYLPADREALTRISDLLQYVSGDGNREIVEKSVRTALDGVKQGKMYVKKIHKNSDEIGSAFSEALAKKTEQDLRALQIHTAGGMDRESVIDTFLEEHNFQEWYNSLCEGNGWLKE